MMSRLHRRCVRSPYIRFLAGIWVLLAVSNVSATVLTFQIENIADGNIIPQDYGDHVTAANVGNYLYDEGLGFTPNISVSYAGNRAQQELNWWSTGYNDLVGVVEYEPDNQSGYRITLTADSGFAVKLDGFDVGNYGGPITVPSITVYGSVGEVLWSAQDVALPASTNPTHVSFSFDPPIISGVMVIAIDTSTLGESSDNVGLDNISFSQITSDSPPILDAISREFSVSVVSPSALEFVDAISREFSVSVNSIDQVEITDALSREFSVSVDAPNTSEITDAISREFSVAVEVTEAVEITDAISREFSVEVAVEEPFEIVDAISREFSVEVHAQESVEIVDAISREFSVYVSAPDLIVTTIEPPASGLTTLPFGELSWMVKNQGDAPAHDTWIERIWIFPASQPFNESLPYVGQQPPPNEFASSLPGLNAGEMQEHSRNDIKCPETPGMYRFAIKVDAYNEVNEADGESNNLFVSNSLINCELNPRPDLVVENIQIFRNDASTTNVQPGQPLNVRWNTRNLDAMVGAVGPITETIFVSVDDQRSSNDPALANRTYSDGVPAGEFRSRNENIVPGAASIPIGPAFLIVCTDTTNPDRVLETEEGNNCAAIPICWNCEQPDLRVVEVSAPEGTVVDGQSVLLTWKVRNERENQPDMTAPAVGAWVDRVFLQAVVEGQITSMYQIGDLPHAGPLAPHGEYSVAQTVTIPPGFHGPYRFVVTTDATGTVSEMGLNGDLTGENNNKYTDENSIIDIQQLLLPDLKIESVTIPQDTLYTNETITVSWKTRNMGPGTATDTTEIDWLDRVYLSDDNTLDEDDVHLTAAEERDDEDGIPFTGTLAPGQFYLRFLTFDLPADDGDGVWYLIIVADALHNVPELEGFDDNVKDAELHVSEPDYYASIEPVVTEVPLVVEQPDGTLVANTIPLNGRTLDIDDSSPAGDVEVTLRVHSQGTRRVFTTDSNASGDYALGFRPTLAEAGRYTVYANHPNVQENTSNPGDPRVTFDIVGLRAEPGALDNNLQYPAEPVNRIVRLRNLGDQVVLGIEANVVIPDAWEPYVQIALNQVPGSLAPSAVADFVVSLQPLGVPQINDSLNAERAANPPKIRVTAMVNGEPQLMAVVSANLGIFSATPDLRATLISPAFDAQGHIAVENDGDAPVIVRYEVRNMGGATAQAVRVEPVCATNPQCDVPDLETCEVMNPLQCPALFLNLVTQRELGDIEPDQSRIIELSLQPRAQTNNLHELSFNVVDASMDGISVVIPVRVFSNATGTLKIRAEDEYTFYTSMGDQHPIDPETGLSAGPLLYGARITVRNIATGATVIDQFHGTDGVMQNLPEGLYSIEITASGHQTHHSTVEIVAEQLTEQFAFLASQGVTYQWIVVPTEVEDVYIITIEAVFETFVPTPRLVITPAVIELDVQPNEWRDFDLEIYNTGWVAAQDVELVLGNPPGFSLSTPFADDQGRTTLGVIGPMETVIVPVRLTGSSGAGAGDCSCSGSGGHVLWSVPCRNSIWYSESIYHRRVECPNSTPCGGGGGGGGGCICCNGACGGSGGGPDDPFWNPPVTISEPLSCVASPDPNDTPPGGDCPPSGGQMCCDEKMGRKGDPVELFSGELTLEVEDLRIPGRGFDFTWSRNYRSKREKRLVDGEQLEIELPNRIGHNWDFSYNIWLEADEANLILHDGHGRVDKYEPSTQGGTTTWVREEFFREISRVGENFILTFSDKSQWQFHPIDNSITSGKLSRITDRNGNAMTFAYDSLGRLSIIADTLHTQENPRLIHLGYEGSSELIRYVEDFAGRRVVYEYYVGNELDGSAGDLRSVTSPVVLDSDEFDLPPGHQFPNGKTTVYAYSTEASTGASEDDPVQRQRNHNLLSITDAKGQVYLRNEYSTATNRFEDRSFDRVVRQTWGNSGESLEFWYGPLVPTDLNRNAVMRTIVNDRVGNVSEYFFDIGNRLIYQRDYTGRAAPGDFTTATTNRPTNKLRSSDPAFYETRYEWNNDSQITRTFHPDGSISENVYESALNANPDARSRGNLREVRRTLGNREPAGEQPQLAATNTYHDGQSGCCGFNFVKDSTDARGNVTSNEYDQGVPGGPGNRTQTTYPSGEDGAPIVENWEYNAFGQMTAHILPDNGSNHRRVDKYAYYDDPADPVYGKMFGYLKEEIVDFGGLNLTNRYEYDRVGNVIRRVDPRGSATDLKVNQLNQVVREITPPDVNGVRYERDSYYDANNNVVRMDIQNVNDDGVVPSETTHFTTLYDYEILNNVVSTCQEFDTAQLDSSVRACAELPVELRGKFVITKYEYDANRNRTLVRFGDATRPDNDDPYGDPHHTFNVVATRYDERDLAFEEIMAPDHPGGLSSTTRYDYDGQRNRVRMYHGTEDPEGAHLTTYEFDAYKREVRVIDPMGNETRYEYDANGNRVRELILGELDDVPGSANNIRLSESRQVFDPLNRPVRTEVAFFDAQTQSPIEIEGFPNPTPGLAVTETQYTPNSQIKRVINDNGHATETRYDTANRRYQSIDAKGNIVEYGYDPTSNLVSVREIEKSDLGTPDEVFLTTFQFDRINRQTAAIQHFTNSDGLTCSVDPEPNAACNVTRSFYDSRSNVTRTIDARNHEVLHQYDGMSRLVRTIRDMDGEGRNSADPAARPNDPGPDIVTEQTWDHSSRLTSQTDDNGNPTRYVYDSLGRKFREVYADFTEKRFEFDAHHNNVFWTDANENEVIQRFDANDRMIVRDVTPGPGVSPDTTFEIYKFDGLNRLTMAEDDDTRVTREYDSLGHVTREIQELYDDPALVWPPAVVKSEYDAVGNMLKLHYPSGQLVTTTYDELERKKTISDQDSMIATYWYVGSSRVQRREYGNGTRSEWSYDGILGVPNEPNDFGVETITRMRHTVISATLCMTDADCPSGNTCEQDTSTCIVEDRTYTWDRAGNKSQRKDARPNGPQLTSDYQYDRCNRLRESVKSGPGIDIETIAYHLDGVGNRTLVEGGPDAGIYSMVAALPEPGDYQMHQYSMHPGGASYYDANGNIIAYGDHSDLSTYDARDRRVSGARGSVLLLMKYDAIGRRVLTDRGSSTRVVFSVDWRELEEHNSTDVATIIYGDYVDERVCQIRTPVTSFLIQDDQFSIVAMVSQVPHVLERYEYDDFGKPQFLDGYGQPLEDTQVAAHYMYTGRHFDSELQTYAFRRRELWPQTAQFGTRDPIGLWGDLGSLGNGRTYVRSNPGRFTDPRGEMACDIKCNLRYVSYCFLIGWLGTPLAGVGCELVGVVDCQDRCNDCLLDHVEDRYVTVGECTNGCTSRKSTMLIRTTRVCSDGSYGPPIESYHYFPCELGPGPFPEPGPVPAPGSGAAGGGSPNPRTLPQNERHLTCVGGGCLNYP